MAINSISEIGVYCQGIRFQFVSKFEECFRGWLAVYFRECRELKIRLAVGDTGSDRHVGLKITTKVCQYSSVNK